MKCFYCKKPLKEKKTAKGTTYRCEKCSYVEFVPKVKKDVVE